MGRGWEKRSRRGSNYRVLSAAEVKTAWSYTSIPPPALTAPGLTATILAAPLISRRCILNIYSTNIRTEHFKHAGQSRVFSVQNAVYFIMLPCLVPVLFTF
jgi:hypothetical protein